MTIRNTAALLALASCGLASTANAASLAQGTYQILNHPDGSQANPGYGLRLDGLVDGQGSTVYTFDFNADALGSEMFLTYDGDSIRIFGTAWGGEDVGETYADARLWTIDFTYMMVTEDAMDAGGVIDLLAGETGSGTISSDLGSYDLLAYAGGFPYAFGLGDEDGNGHRGFDGISGWGWLQHAPTGDTPAYLGASDWLFTIGEMQPPRAVPLPAAGWLLFGALGGAGLFGRRRG